jgi:hypothetical protein
MLPFPHSSSGYKKLITPSGKKLVPLYPGFLMYPAFFDRPMITTFTTKTNNRQKKIFTTDEHAGLQDEPNIYFFMSLLLYTKATIFIIK